jgi:hypothetical protein
MITENISQHIYTYHQKIQCLSTQSSQSGRSKSKLLDEVREWAWCLIQPVEQKVVQRLCTIVPDPAQTTIKKLCIIKKWTMNDKWLAWMNNWELTNKENGWDEVSTNLINFNVHFSISTIVVFKIKHTEECTVVLCVLCCLRYIRKSPVQNVREQRCNKHLKNIVKSSADFDKNGRVISVLVILLFPVLSIKNFNSVVDFVDTIHSPMCIVDHRYEYLLEKLLSCKK